MTNLPSVAPNSNPSTSYPVNTKTNSNSTASVSSSKERFIADIQMQISALISLLIQYNLESRKNQFQDTLNEVNELIKAANTHLEAAKVKLIAGCISGALQMVMGVAALYTASNMAKNIKVESSQVTFKGNPGASNKSSGVNSGNGTANQSSAANSAKGTPNQSSGANSAKGAPNQSSAVASSAAKQQASKTTQNTESAKDLDSVNTPSNKNTADLNKADDLQNPEASASSKANSNKEESIAEQNNKSLEMKFQAAQSAAKALDQIISSGLEYHSAQIDCDSEIERANAKKYSALANVDDSTLRAINDALAALYQILQQLNNMEVSMNQTLTR